MIGSSNAQVTQKLTRKISALNLTLAEKNFIASKIASTFHSTGTGHTFSSSTSGAFSGWITC